MNTGIVFGRPVALRARRRIFGVGILVAFVVGVSASLSLAPLLAVHHDNTRMRADNDAVQEFVELRTALAGWQFYIEPRFAELSAAPATVDPVDLAKGAQLASDIVAQTPVAVAGLRANGLALAGANLIAATAAFTKSVTALGPLSAGRPLPVIAAAVADERAAFNETWSIASNAADELRQIAAVDLQRSTRNLNNGREVIVIVDAAFAIVACAAAGVFGQSARRRERGRRDDSQRRAFETVLQEALEMAKAEPDVYDVLDDALRSSVPELQVELLVADSSRAHFRRTLSTAPETGGRDGCGVTSPHDCPATIRGRTMSFSSSTALNACPHLKDRASGPCSATCVAVNIGGNATGVMHATGPDRITPAATEVRYLEISSRRASERIAMLRAFAKSESQARSDPLTGLLNRRSLENRVRDLHREGVPYMLAYADLDHFKLLNDTHGHEAGDQALRLFTQVMCDSVRPGDLVSRYGGEEFVIVLPRCTPDAAVAVLERVREHLALALTGGRVPSYTVSFGLTASIANDTFDQTVARADGALLDAKAAGRNRVIVADKPPASITIA